MTSSNGTDRLLTVSVEDESGHQRTVQLTTGGSQTVEIDSRKIHIEARYCGYGASGECSVQTDTEQDQ